MLEIYLKISEISPKNPNPLCIEENARKKKNFTAQNLAPAVFFS
jgi:hypothetical protein